MTGRGAALQGLGPAAANLQAILPQGVMTVTHRLCLLAVPALALALCLGARAEEGYVHWDFETGDLQGWRLVWGNLGRQPSNHDDDRWGGNFGKQGKWFIGTYEDGGDAMQGELRSPIFTLKADKVSFLIGGGAYRESTFVALVLAEGDKEINRATGANAEAMTRVVWDVAKYKGQKAYFRVVDRNSGGWGHVNLDDVRELTPQEVADMERAERERKEAAERKYQEWKKGVFAPTQPTVYRGETLKRCEMTLGAVGGGCLALCGDGALRQWQLSNHVCSRAQVPYGFLAITAQTEGGPRVARVLQTEPVDGLPCVEATEFVGEYPLGTVIYRDSALPVKARLEGFCPFIPLDAKDSGLPSLFLTLHLDNPGDRPVQVGAMMSLQNFIGWDGRSGIQGLQNAGFGGNANRVERQGDRVSVVFESPTLDRANTDFGSLALSCLEPEATATAQWDDSAALWADFAPDGKLDNPGVPGPSDKGRTHNGALAVRLTLQPGESVELPFVLSWHFPNRHAEYDGNLAKYRLGCMYNNWFADASAVAAYACDNYPRLRDETQLFHDTFYASNLPYWLLDCVSSQMSTIASPTCLWIEDGTFHGFEGCGGDTGCCPMNCTHVWNYEQTMAHIFPELERNVRHTDLFVQQDPRGFVHHRTVLPLSLPRGSGPFADGHLSTISKAYREHRMSADDSWLRQSWPHIKAAMDWAIRAYDPEGDGVIKVEQWNTYDCSVWGPNTFIGSQWLAALRAAEEMAKLMGDQPSAARYRTLFDQGSAKMDQELWNGEWWIQNVDLKEHPNTQYATGCHADQLLGQWWAHLNDLGYIFPREHVDAALRSIFKYNFMKSFEGFGQSPRVFCAPDDMGLLICTWPRGGRPGSVTYYSDEVWTGIEYAVAGLMIQEGLIDEAYQITKAARDRYDGRQKPSRGGYNGAMRSPWNEIECGEHYARTMSSYSLLMGVEGYAYDGPAGALKFAPKVQPEGLSAFFTTAEGWGSFEQKRAAGAQTDVISLARGKLSLRQLEFELPEGAGAAAAEVKLRDEALRAKVTVEGRKVTVVFGSPVVLAASDSLSVKLTW